MFELLVLAVATLAGIVAAIAGFGIGSLITPIFAIAYPLKVAVAAVAIPHLLATATRLWLMRAHIDRKLLLSFGLASAIGGLLGALLQSRSSSAVLMMIFGGALILASTRELFFARSPVRSRFSRGRFPAPWADW